MSERTTIGGTVYEVVGSSSSNLLLKCNGTARIQWGNKLIDLIKNGKIASENSSTPIFVISDESDIKSDGIYVLQTENSSQLWIRKNSETYNFTDTDLYISASTKQNITVDQQRQALENIGMYYNTLDDVKKAGVQNGLVYVLEDKSLYTVTEGVITEFEAKLKAIAVEENEEGEIINSSVKVVLSVMDTEYLVLKDKRITAKQNVHIPKYLQLGSEDASETYGYRLFFKNDESWLEVDNITVRNGIPIKDYIEVTFDDLLSLIEQNSLESQQWYVISDYQNVWRLPANNPKFNRPIMLRAVTSNSFYPEGCLYDDRRITINYDPFYIKGVLCSDGSWLNTRGKITWMKDTNGNEANFDFLDYEDHEGKPLTTLHYTVSNIKGDGSFDVSAKSVFPVNSSNNKIIIHNLKRTVLKKDANTGEFTGEFDDTNTVVVDFKIKDSIDLESEITESVVKALPTMIMHDNIIDCYGLSTSETCLNFYNNNLKNVGKVLFSSDCIDNTLTDVYSIAENITPTSLDSYVLNEVHFPSSVVHTTINGCIKSAINGSLTKVTFGVVTNSAINKDIFNSTFNDISNCTLNAYFSKCTFGNLTDCVFGEGHLENIICRSDVYAVEVSSEAQPILYDQSKIKDVYFINGEFQVNDSASVNFTRGMIVMHCGNIPIPEGWAICDGKLHTYDWRTTRTPDLIGKFIKAVGSADEVGEVKVHNKGKSNELVLEEKHLPPHSHPHSPHKHNISGASTDVVSALDISTTSVVASISGLESDAAIETTEVLKSVESTSQNVQLSGSSTTETTSTEANKSWANQAITIEPNHYSLIFIMKL